MKSLFLGFSGFLYILVSLVIFDNLYDLFSDKFLRKDCLNGTKWSTNIIFIQAGLSTRLGPYLIGTSEQHRDLNKFKISVL